MTVKDTVTASVGLLKPQHVMMLILGALILAAVYHVLFYVYNIYFHPLSKYPGPRLAAATPLWLVSSYFGGKTPTDLLELHNKYGPVVRTSPDGLSYIKSPQWKEIYGHKTGQLEFAKDEKYFAGLKGEPIILNADRHYHGYIRKLFAHGFSEKALREQEPVLKEYVDLMFQKIVQEGQNGHMPVDILKWYNFVTFDFIGYLSKCLISTYLDLGMGITRPAGPTGTREMGRVVMGSARKFYYYPRVPMGKVGLGKKAHG
nr:averantin oxidoreductase [Colletotrichum truncatum]KAF6781243.1 averantin oxidoreductase [Colletotrichum truncatum]